jgi:Protein of unknown function (DUF3019)
MRLTSDILSLQMFFSIHPVVRRFFLLTTFLFWMAGANATEALLQIKPARCIALHEGQLCYQTLKIQWETSNADNYCLYQQGSSSPLVCWDNVAQATEKYEFESSTSQKFVLIRKSDAQVVADFIVTVAWVYDANTHRENHWRIF